MSAFLMAADTQRFRRRHRFTLGVVDHWSWRGAGSHITVTT
ncbi:hypothetical protein [Actinoplanes friuliensis]|nr:hypothetical protein [Actinoplanes friuliensis]